MERCPNCGTDVREGSKFCTTCGHRFADSGSEAPAPSPMSDSATGMSAPDQETLADHAMAAWPAFASPRETPVPEGWSWQPAPSPSMPTLTGEPQSEIEATPNAEGETDPWVARSNDASGEVPAIAPDAPDPVHSAVRATDTQSGGNPVELVDRASQLLSELRQLVSAAPVSSPRDLSGVISELEVAVTPPGAIPPDELAALRDALFAARERPRDLDTVVDLTGRIEALISLVIAYDRAMAAIERALDVLRETGASEPT